MSIHPTLKRFTLLLLLLAATSAARAISIPDSLNYTFRLGYNIGGTAPVGMPATIRSMNSYDFQPNVTVGLDIWRDFWDKWGVATGLHIENKGMKIDATVKNYHMEMVQGGERLEGMYTGRLVTDCNQWMITIPVMATYHSGRWLLKCGPYVSYVATSSFKGYVYDGYLRKGDPTGDKVSMGAKGDNNPTYDFSDDMRKFQWGLNIGADYRIGRRIGVYADLSWGLNGAFKSSFKTIEQTLYPIYGTIGISYKMK